MERWIKTNNVGSWIYFRNNFPAGPLCLLSLCVLAQRVYLHLHGQYGYVWFIQCEIQARTASCCCHCSTRSVDKLQHCKHWSVCIFTQCQRVGYLCNKLSCSYKTDGHYWSSANSLTEAKCLICCWDGSLLTSAPRRLTLHCASQAMPWHPHLSTGRALRMALTVTTWQNDRL